jgi:hypothetical protein
MTTKYRGSSPASGDPGSDVIQLGVGKCTVRTRQQLGTMEMSAMTSILGLPAHPFFAHIPVVLIPLAALGAVLMVWPVLRDKIGWFVVGIVFVAGICTQLTISSGQSLEQYVQETQLIREHTHLGENIRPWVLLMFVTLLGVMIVAQVARRRATATGNATENEHGVVRGGRDGLRIVTAGLVVLSLVFSAMATYWIYRIGHSGSKAVWAATQTKIDKGIRAPGSEGRGGHGG